jgi:hypothetical protein
VKPAFGYVVDGETVTGYRCPRCRHVWTTSRLNSAYPPPGPQGTSAAA